MNYLNAENIVYQYLIIELGKKVRQIEANGILENLSTAGNEKSDHLNQISTQNDRN